MLYFSNKHYQLQPDFEKTLYMTTAIITDNDTLTVLVSQQNLTGLILH
jgi:hypothetical protein